MPIFNWFLKISRHFKTMNLFRITSVLDIAYENQRCRNPLCHIIKVNTYGFFSLVCQPFQVVVSIWISEVQCSIDLNGGCFCCEMVWIYLGHPPRDWNLVFIMRYKGRNFTLLCSLWGETFQKLSELD